MKTTVQAIQDLKVELKSAQTMEEFLSICGKHFDFKNAKLGPISRTSLISGIGTVINLSGAKPK